MDYLLLFLAGALVTNSIPHLAAGLRGEPFPTPFARPRGVGDSPPLTNFLWGYVNAGIGCAVLLHWFFAADHKGGFAAVAAGALAIGVYLSIHFGKVRKRH